MEVMQHLAAGGVCYSSVRERWESQADLDAHGARMRQAPPPDGATVKPTAVQILVYDVTGERPLG